MASESPPSLGDRKSETRGSRASSADRRLTQTYLEASSLSIALAKLPGGGGVGTAIGEDMGHRKDSNSGPMMPARMNPNEASVAQRSLNMRVHKGKRASTELISSNERELRVSLLRRKLMMEEEPIRHRRTYRTAPSAFMDFSAVHAAVGACVSAVTPPLLASAPEPTDQAAQVASSQPSSPAQRAGSTDDKAPVMLADIKARMPQSSKHAFNPNVLSMRALPGRRSSMGSAPPLVAFRSTSHRASSSRRFSQLAASMAEHMSASSDDAIRQLINEDGSSDEGGMSEAEHVAGGGTMTEATAIAKMREHCTRTAAQAAADHASLVASSDQFTNRAASLFALDELDDRALIALTRDEGSDEEEEDYMRHAEAIGNANVYFPDEQKQARRAARGAQSAARRSTGGAEGKADVEGEDSAPPPDILAPMPERSEEPVEPARESTTTSTPKGMNISDLLALRKANVGRSTSQESIASTDSSEETPRSGGNAAQSYFAARRSILPSTSSSEPATSSPTVPPDNRPTEPIVLPYEALVRPQNLPENVDVTKRELYLAQEEFEQIFGMSREAFVSLPKWKRLEKKKQTRLF